jgi:hypothetical protein
MKHLDRLFRRNNPRWFCAVCLLYFVAAQADTTISANDHMAYGSNLGWIDWRGDMANGAVIGEFICSGYLYGANVGWISLGDGEPANRVQYQNESAGDYGVNHDGQGNLRGYAWGANVGWINFENTGNPRVDLATGVLGGYAWSANCGWISLSNAYARVQTTFIAAAADTDHDGIADAWELSYVRTLDALSAFGDADADGQSDLEEYLADTNPLDPDDCLQITDFSRAGSYNLIKWTSKPSRFYRVDRRASLNPSSVWETYLSDDAPGWSNVGFNNFGVQYFYRIRAVKPLSP